MKIIADKLHLDRLARECRNRQMFAVMRIGVAYQVRALRVVKGLTISDLALKAGIPERRLFDIERGRLKRLDDLKRIAAACDVAIVARFAPFSEAMRPMGNRSVAPPSFDDDVRLRDQAEER